MRGSCEYIVEGSGGLRNSPVAIFSVLLSFLKESADVWGNIESEKSPGDQVFETEELQS